MRAAKWAMTNKKLITIHHDYQGISCWVDGSWKAKNDMTKAYRDYMAQMRPDTNKAFGSVVSGKFIAQLMNNGKPVYRFTRDELTPENR